MNGCPMGLLAAIGDKELLFLAKLIQQAEVFSAMENNNLLAGCEMCWE
jgi:hypothetical protein